MKQIEAPLLIGQGRKVEFTDSVGKHRAFDVFLNSYAADDYKELAAPGSTLVSMEFRSTSEAIIGAVVNGLSGRVRRHNGEGWTPL